MKSTTTAAEMDRRAGTRNEEKKPIRDKEGDMPVHLSPGGGAEIDRQAGTRNAAGRYIHQRYRARVVIALAGTATQLRC